MEIRSRSNAFSWFPLGMTFLLGLAAWATLSAGRTWLNAWPALTIPFTGFALILWGANYGIYRMSRSRHVVFDEGGIMDSRTAPEQRIPWASVRKMTVSDRRVEIEHAQGKLTYFPQVLAYRDFDEALEWLAQKANSLDAIASEK